MLVAVVKALQLNKRNVLTKENEKWVAKQTKLIETIWDHREINILLPYIYFFLNV